MLPIDPLLPEILASLANNPRLVLEAPPGAGKTTRVPRALCEAFMHDPGEVLVTEPRRLAARLAASHVASTMGVPLGGLVGYSVRFEDKSGPQTRLRYATEGVVLQRLLGDPALSSVHSVVLDEFHERHLATDQLLALLDDLCRRRPDLRLVVMSATLDADPIARFLGDCPRLRSDGRVHAITLRHQPEPDERPLEKQVASAVRDIAKEQTAGDVLVFLPGAGEIERCRRLLEERDNPFEMHVLHGEMPMAAQAAAVAPSRQRKLILATNVAESSVTIDGVTAVVDSGTARIAGYSPFSGRATLTVSPISKSSATQRAGRAGRTAPGLVLRLFTEEDFRRRPERDTPELLRSDLSQFVLQLLGMGHHTETLRWLQAPPATALDAATGLLSRLGAIDERSELTPIGRAMVRLPTTPRLGRLLHSAVSAGIGDDGALAAAILSERDIRVAPRGAVWDLPSGPCDIAERMEAFRQANDANFRPGPLRAMGLDGARVRAVERSYRQLLRLSKQLDGPRHLTGTSAERERLLRRCLLHAFNDRVALHQPEGGRLILSNGTSAKVSPLSIVRHAPLVIALELEERHDARGGAARVQWMSSIEPDWLLDDYPDGVSTSDELRFDGAKQRVEAISRLSYGSVTLDESRIPAQPGPEVARVLFEAAKGRKAAIFGKRSAGAEYAERIAVLRNAGVGDGWPNSEQLDEDHLLRTACETATSIEELSEVDFAALLQHSLTPAQQRLLLTQAPSAVSLPSGRRLDVHYEPGKPPWVASRLQDFFGMKSGPVIAEGRVPLTLHLLAPNQRAVQVTSDLHGFWERHYAEVRKELRRRYPKHPWPEDGANAEPPPPRPPRRR